MLEGTALGIQRKLVMYVLANRLRIHPPRAATLQQDEFLLSTVLEAIESLCIRLTR